MSIFFGKHTDEKENYFRDEAEVMQSIQGPQYDYDNMSYQEKKSYLESDKKKWYDFNYRKFILNDIQP